MKKGKFFWAGLIALSFFGFTACDDDDENNSKVEDVVENEAYKAVIDNYVDNIVIPTYADLKEKAKVLEASVKAVYDAKQNGVLTDALIEAACNQWVESREPWEESEAFLFGPADTYGLDPLLDSWPLNTDDIQKILTSKSYETLESIEGEAGETTRGFHTLEYFLFAEGKAKTVNSLTADEIAYAYQTAKLITKNATQLWYAWAGAADATSEDLDVIKSSGFDAECTSVFGEYFKSPKLTSDYKTQADVIGQIVDGCTDICNEVAGQKIGGPFNADEGRGNILEVESWTSYHSMVDYENNIISIQHSYMGTMSDDIADLDNVGGNLSISSLVAAENPELDKDIREQIAAARTAIANISTTSFALAIKNHTNATEIQAAMDACYALFDTFGKIKTVIK